MLDLSNMGWGDLLTAAGVLVAGGAAYGRFLGALRRLDALEERTGKLEDLLHSEAGKLWERLWQVDRGQRP